MGVSAEVIAENGTTFRRMIGLVRGRIYYDLLNWHRVLAMLPGYSTNRAFMEQMMGVKEPLPATVDLGIAPVGRARDAMRLVRTVAGLVANFALLGRRKRAFAQRLDAALGAGNGPDLSTMRADELVAHYRSLEKQLLTRWDAPLVNDFFAMIFYGVLRELVRTWCGDTEGTLQNDLLCGGGGVISAEPAERVREMARVAAITPGLATVLTEGSPSEGEAAIRRVPELKRLYEEYLDRFGDRCLEELKLESPTLRDDPYVLVRSIGVLAGARIPDSGSGSSRTRAVECATARTCASSERASSVASARSSSSSGSGSTPRGRWPTLATSSTSKSTKCSVGSTGPRRASTSARLPPCAKRNSKTIVRANRPLTASRREAPSMRGTTSAERRVRRSRSSRRATIDAASGARPASFEGG
jgi:hypothetical protein